MRSHDLIQLGVRDQLRMIESVATLLRAGLDPARAFLSAAEAARSGAMPRAARRISDLLGNGHTLGDALRRSVTSPDPYLAAMVAVADRTGAITGLLSRAEVRLRDRAGVLQAVVAAVAYPAFVMILAIVGAVVLGLVVIPRMSGTLSSAGLLTPTGAADLVRRTKGLSWGLLAAVAAGAAGAALTLAPRRHGRTAGARGMPPGRLRRLSDVLTAVQATEAALSVGIALDAGLDLGAGCTRNTRIARAFRESSVQIRAGVPASHALGPAFDRIRFAAPILELMEAGADSRETLDALACMVARDRQRRIATLRAAAEPAAVIVAGTMLLTVILVLVRPLLQISLEAAW